MIKVSIVIPVFNCAGSLRECLSGLKLIATREIQVVVDDGSTDQSPLVALGFREESRILHIKEFQKIKAWETPAILDSSYRSERTYIFLTATTLSVEISRIL